MPRTTSSTSGSSGASCRRSERRRSRAVTESLSAGLRAGLERVLTDPTPAGLWEVQKELLALDGEAARRARDVAGAFHSCLRNLESKTASRGASRTGAALGTAAVVSVGLEDIYEPQ